MSNEHPVASKREDLVDPADPGTQDLTGLTKDEGDLG